MVAGSVSTIPVNQETCEIVARSAGPLRWRFVAVTPSRQQIRDSEAFLSRLLVPNQGRISQRALDRLVAHLVTEGWQVVRRNDDAPRRSRGDWWATYLVRVTPIA